MMAGSYCKGCHRVRCSGIWCARCRLKLEREVTA